MLQWTGGSRRKVATSRKSTHTRQKQYFEQRKRQRQASSQENFANKCDKQVFHNAETRSLDILNLITLAVPSRPEFTASVDSRVTKISDDNLLGKATDIYLAVIETRSEEVTNSSDSNLPQVRQTDSCRCAGQTSKFQMPGAIPDHTSSWKDDTFSEKNENPQIEAAVLDLLSDDGPYSNRRSIPETHVALSVEGLGRIGSQTPAHSPRMQNRFSCNGFSMASKAARQARSTSVQGSAHNDCNVELNDMIDYFRVSPLCNKGGTWACNGAKATCKSRVAPVPSYSHEEQVDEISNKEKGFEECLLVSNEKHPNDSFGYLEKQFIREGYDAASHNQKFSFVGYPFLNSSTKKKFENFEASDVGVRDTFLGSSRNLWEGVEIFEALATSTPHFRHSTSEEKGNPSFIWESDDANADGMFKPPIWSFLSTEDSQDNISILSEDLNSPTAVRKKNSLNTHSMKFKENKGNSSEKNFMRIFSQDENIFTGFDDAVWGKKQNSNFAFKKSDDENIFSPRHVLPSDPFRSFTMKSTTSSGYEALFQDDHFDLFPAPKSNFKIPSEWELTNDFINQNEMLGKKTAFEFNSHKPMEPSTKAKSLGQCCSSGGDFFKEAHFSNHEDRGSSGKPQPKDYEKRSTSSENAESAAGAVTSSKATEHEESKSRIPDPSDCQKVENSNEQTEVISNLMEELPTQIQNYVHSKLNQFQGRSPVPPSHPGNEESKETFGPEIKEARSECGGNGDASYQVMLQSYVFQLLCVQKVLLEASGKDIKKV